MTHTTKYITERVDPRAVLAEAVTSAGGQTALARRIGISRTFITNTLAGRRPFSARLLAALGIERVTIYVRHRAKRSFFNTVQGEPWTPQESEGEQS